MINDLIVNKEKAKVELRHVGRHHYQLWIDNAYVSEVSGRENIFKVREQYPDATIIAPR